MERHNEAVENQLIETKQPNGPPAMAECDVTLSFDVCPNCGARLEGRKCKLLCPRPGCGYMVTCSEW